MNTNKIRYSNINDKKKKTDIAIKTDTKNTIYIVHRALINQLENKRQGNAHTKTRSEVKGGGRKPWKQKGSGKARAGSNRSPLWRGGGIVFGPRKKNYKKKINKKEKNLAIKTLIENKKKNTIIIPNLTSNLQKPNTKYILNILNKVSLLKINSIKNILIINDQNDNILYLSTRNLNNIELITINNINILSLVKANKILITSNALKTMEKQYK